MALKFGLQRDILLYLCLLCLLIALFLLNELSFGFRDHILVFVVSHSYICPLQLRANFLTIGSLASLFGLRINFRGVECLSLSHSGVLLCVSERELGFLHARL